MSDAINDIEKEKEKSRLENLDIKEVSREIQRLRKKVVEYNNLKSDLISTGYIVKEYGERIEVWRQIL